MQPPPNPSVESGRFFSPKNFLDKSKKNTTNNKRPGQCHHHQNKLETATPIFHGMPWIIIINRWGFTHLHDRSKVHRISQFWRLRADPLPPRPDFFGEKKIAKNIQGRFCQDFVETTAEQTFFKLWVMRIQRSNFFWAQNLQLRSTLPSFTPVWGATRPKSPPANIKWQQDTN